MESVPIPIHPDTPLARCTFCPAAFVAQDSLDRRHISAHEAACPQNPATFSTRDAFAYDHTGNTAWTGKVNITAAGNANVIPSTWQTWSSI